MENEVAKRKENPVVFINEENKYEISRSLPFNRTTREVFLSSKNFPKIKNIEDKNHVVDQIHIYINQMIVDSGYNMDKDDILYIKTQVSKDILSNFAHYTLEEIRLAFYYGVRGELGQFMGINVVTLNDFLKKYKTDMLSEANKKVMPHFKDKEDEQEPTEKEIDEKTISIVLEVYETLIKEKKYEFYDIGNLVYKFLEKIGVIYLTEEEKLEILNKSREHFKTSIKKENDKLYKQGKTFQLIDIEKAYKEIDGENNESYEAQIKIGARRLALFEFLKQMASQEADLKGLIEEKFEAYHKNKENGKD